MRAIGAAKRLFLVLDGEDALEISPALKRLAQAIEAVFARGGCVLMPLFALGKTQEFLTIFHGLRTRGRLRRDCPIYIGGLGAKLTEVYDKLAAYRQALELQPDFAEAWSNLGNLLFENRKDPAFMRLYLDDDSASPLLAKLLMQF